MISIFAKTLFLIDKKFSNQLLWLYFIVVVGTLLEAFGISLILPFLKIVIDSKEGLYETLSSIKIFEGLANYFFQKNFDELDLLNLIILVFTIKIIFFLYLINKQAKISHLIEFELSKKIFQFYLNQDYLFHLSRNSSKLLTIITEEIRNFRLSLVDPLLTISSEIIFLLIISGFLIYLEPLVFFSAFSVIIVISFFYLFFTKKKLTDAAYKRQINESLKIQHLREGLNGIKEIKISGNETTFLSVFDKHNLETVKARAWLNFLTAIPRYVLEFTGVLSISLLSIYMIKKGMLIKAFLPTLGVFVIAILRLLPSISKITQSIGKIRFGLPSADLLIDELKNSEQNKYIKKEKFLNSKKIKFEKLLFKNISFYYPGTNKNKKVLNNISFEINKGDKIGIIGTSGSGKSTLVDIMTGLIVPSEGQIILNNQLVNLKSSNYYKIIGYSPQTVYLTDDTILSNIALGTKKEDVILSDINNACKIAAIDNYINSLNEGFNTRVGEMGVKLSGGQRQRIGIARTLYLYPQIMFFDESTSAIDLKTEEKIIDNILKFKDRTIIIVSHRESTIKQCNKIFEIKEGKINYKK